METVHVTASPENAVPVPANLFGSFIEHIGSCIRGGIVSGDGTVRQDTESLCRELGPSVLRFPGGTVMGIYHWQDYVGPAAERKKVKNIVWGGMMERSFGTAEFIAFCRRIGAQPMICVNMPTGSAEEAAAWVEYCNGTEDTHYANLRRSHGWPEPFGVKYWCIGNESYAEPDLGTQHDVRTYIRDAWEFTKYMKMTDPTIELVYVGHDEAWNRAVLEAFAPVCDYLSVHFYAGGEDCFAQTAGFEADTLRPLEDLLDAYSAQSRPLSRWYRIPGRSHPIRLALDEWNIWNSDDSASPYGLTQHYTFRDALWTADFLILLIRHAAHIGIANLAQMVNVIAPIMADESGAWRQTTFYPFALFREACGDRLTGAVSCGSCRAVLTERDGQPSLLAVVPGDGPVRLELPFTAQSVTLATAKELCAVNGPGEDFVQLCRLSPASRTVTLPGRCFCVIR